MRIFYYFLALLVIIIDQWSKWLIAKSMMVGQSMTLIPGFLYFTSSRNTGAAWSILEGQRIFFFIITTIVVIIIIYYMQKLAGSSKLLGVALGMVLGGSIGNFIDRAIRGEVIDFIHVYIGSYSYPIFNAADSSLVIGVILILIYIFLEGKKEKQHGNH